MKISRIKVPLFRRKFHVFVSIIATIWGIIGMFEKHNWSKLEHKRIGQKSSIIGKGLAKFAALYKHIATIILKGGGWWGDLHG